MNFKDRKFLDPYIICEIGVNHEGDLGLAMEMIEQVARAGGHAAKFQTYKADKLASKVDSQYYWNLNEEPSTSQHALFSKYDKFEIEDYIKLSEHCKKHKVDFMSTPFDLDAVDWLVPMMKSFKIASADCTNVPLLRKIASKKMPVIMSTGASQLYEIEKSLSILFDGGAPEVTLLHCVLNYPTPQENAQMQLMHLLKHKFGEQCGIGYSDHVKTNADGTMPALEMATLNGAVVIEKHYTYDKSLKGNDHYHAMNENDLSCFVAKLEEYRCLFGEEKRKLKLEEKAIQNARRRIVTSKSIVQGEVLSENNLIPLRASSGLEIHFWDEVLGKKATKDLNSDLAIQWGDFE